jgi:hypothetical protein
MFLTAIRAAEATGLPLATVEAIKAATKGQPDSPFLGHYTTKRKLEAWILTHPEFEEQDVQQQNRDTASK